MQKRSDIYRLANREAKWALILAVAYFLWWYGTAYGFAPAATDTQLPELFFGLPLWFLLSCVVGPVLFTILCFLMVKYLYRHLPLEIQDNHNDE
jgi:uncharacterized membrane protein YhdT